MAANGAGRGDVSEAWPEVAPGSRRTTAPSGAPSAGAGGGAEGGAEGRMEGAYAAHSGGGDNGVESFRRPRRFGTSEAYGEGGMRPGYRSYTSPYSTYGADGYGTSMYGGYGAGGYASRFGRPYGAGMYGSYGGFGAGGYGGYGMGAYGGMGPYGASAMGALGAGGSMVEGFIGQGGDMINGVQSRVQEVMQTFARVSGVLEELLRNFHMIFESVFGLFYSAQAFRHELGMQLNCKDSMLRRVMGRVLEKLLVAWRLLFFLAAAPFAHRFSPVRAILRMFGLAPALESSGDGDISVEAYERSNNEVRENDPSNL